jgi:hypothetical protein
MATWERLKEHIGGTFEAVELEPRIIAMQFATTARRTQTVYVTHLVAEDGSEWAAIDSVVGHELEVDLLAALRAVSTLACGGLSHLRVQDQDMVALRHVVPLATVDAEEFDLPLILVTGAADALEQVLLGTDQA